MTLDTFQKAYGQRYGKIVESPELKAALMIIRSQRRDYLLSLTDQQIAQNSDRILGNVIGSLRFECDLLTLHNKKTFTIDEDAPLEYVSPEEESIAWAAIDSFRSNGSKQKQRK